MSTLVSTIYYNDRTIEIHWDSNILVENSGLWVILPDMTIRNVLYSLGFQNNTMYISEDVIDLYVSCAPRNIIQISSEKPSEIIPDYDLHISDNVNNISKAHGCIKSIMKKLNSF
jgi:hypothetical protein